MGQCGFSPVFARVKKNGVRALCWKTIHERVPNDAVRKFFRVFQTIDCVCFALPTQLNRPLIRGFRRGEFQGVGLRVALKHAEYKQHGRADDSLFDDFHFGSPIGALRSLVSVWILTRRATGVKCAARIRPVRHDVAKQFGLRIRKLRGEQELSQEALAAKADIDRAFLSGIERGVENPTLFTIQAIADALKTTIGNLTKGI